MNKSYNRNYEEYILNHITKFKKHVIESLDESISFIQSSIKDRGLELERMEKKRVQKNEYSKLFKP